MSLLASIRQLGFLAAVFFSCADAFGTRQVQFNYIGCFMDGTSGVRDMDGMKNNGLNRIGGVNFTSYPDSVTSSQLTHEVCAGVCAMGGFRYFGVQATEWCFCNNAYGSQGIAAESDCGQSCKGNSAQICGGAFRNSVFQLTYLNDGLFSPGSPTAVTLSNQTAPQFTTATSVRSLLECTVLCNSPVCQAVVFLKQQFLCHLIEFPALPSSLAAEEAGEFYVRG